jgi:hypothetical protein
MLLVPRVLVTMVIALGIGWWSGLVADTAEAMLPDLRSLRNLGAAASTYWKPCASSNLATGSCALPRKPTGPGREGFAEDLVTKTFPRYL